MYKAVYYTTVRGDNPVKKFVDGLDQHTQQKFFAYVELLESEGPNLKRPFADLVEGNIRELRPKQARALYFFAHGNKIVLVHGFLKKRNAIDKKDVEIAKSRMADWLHRNAG
ncbi:MAG: type II toxin-antitoxin system RelE/ParE family toxin [Elusimicrobiota bacterium]|jgi:hypothetical protein